MGKSIGSPASFWPISITSCVTKLFERIILSRLSFFLESNSIFFPARPVSVLDGLLSMKFSFSLSPFQMGVKDISRSLERFLLRLTLPGTTPFLRTFFGWPPSCFARWTQSFFSDRRLCMVYQNHKSRSIRVRRDVPLGFVLGHALISLFINDLSASLPCWVS